VAVREHGDAVLDVEGLGRQPGEVVERDLEQADVGPPVVQVVGPIGAAAEQDVQRASARAGGVGGADPASRFASPPSLMTKVVPGSGVPGALRGQGDGAERPAPVVAMDSR
jgi:hypothetical protein